LTSTPRLNVNFNRNSNGANPNGTALSSHDFKGRPIETA
jgi:hypothetical protein